MIKVGDLGGVLVIEKGNVAHLHCLGFGGEDVDLFAETLDTDPICVFLIAHIDNVYEGSTLANGLLDGDIHGAYKVERPT